MIDFDSPPAFNSAYITEGQVYAISKQGADFQIGEYFELGEFRCGDGSDIVIVHPALVAGLDYIRQQIGGPIIITKGGGGWRSWRYHLDIYEQLNRKPPKHSAHLYGMAADVSSPVATPQEIADIAEDADFGGVGRYDTFTHVDVMDALRRW